MFGPSIPRWMAPGQFSKWLQSGMVVQAPHSLIPTWAIPVNGLRLRILLGVLVTSDHLRL